MSHNNETSAHAKEAIRDIGGTLRTGGADIVAEAQATAHDLRKAATDAAEAARYAGDRVRRHARAARIAGKRALDDAANTAGDATEELRDASCATMANWRSRAEAHVSTKPMTWMAAAAGVGLLLGLFLMRRRRQGSGSQSQSQG